MLGVVGKDSPSSLGKKQNKHMMLPMRVKSSTKHDALKELLSTNARFKSGEVKCDECS